MTPTSQTPLSHKQPDIDPWIAEFKMILTRTLTLTLTLILTLTDKTPNLNPNLNMFLKPLRNPNPDSSSTTPITGPFSSFSRPSLLLPQRLRAG